MNTLTNIILLFIYLFFLLSIKSPNIYCDEHIKNKLILFFSIIPFQIAINMFSPECSEDYKGIVYDSIIVSSLGVIGYTLFFDKKYDMSYGSNFNAKLYLVCVLWIMSLILFYKISKLLLIH